MEQSLEIVPGTGTVFEDMAVVAATVGTAVVVAVTGADVAVGVVAVAGADVAVGVVAVAGADVAVTVGATVVVAGADVAVGVVVVAGAVVAVVGTFLQPRPGGGSADAYWVAATTTEIATAVAITASLFALVTSCSPSYSRGLLVNIRPMRPFLTFTKT
jgi:hypothetical protein